MKLSPREMTAVDARCPLTVADSPTATAPVRANAGRHHRTARPVVTKACITAVLTPRVRRSGEAGSDSMPTPALARGALTRKRDQRWVQDSGKRPGEGLVPPGPYGAGRPETSLLNEPRHTLTHRTSRQELGERPDEAAETTGQADLGQVQPVAELVCGEPLPDPALVERNAPAGLAADGGAH